MADQAQWQLEEKFIELVQRRVAGRRRDLRLLLTARGVVLQGRVSSYYAKQLVQQAAIEVAGQRVITNEVEVQVVMALAETAARDEFQ